MSISYDDMLRRYTHPSDGQCIICLEEGPMIEISCKHTMHMECYKKWFATKKRLNCPYCGDMEMMKKNEYCKRNKCFYKYCKCIEYNTPHLFNEYKKLMKAKRMLRDWVGSGKYKEIRFTNDCKDGALIDYPVDRELSSLSVGWDIQIGGIGNDYVPTAAECVWMRRTIIAVFDVICPHKGNVRHIFNIYKHGREMDSAVINMIKNYDSDIMIYEVDMRWILDQKKIPDVLEIRHKW